MHGQVGRLALCFLLIAAPSIGLQEDSTPLLTGTVIKVVDGDTVDVQLHSGRIRVRLFAIDAPELNQPWGHEARAAAAAMVDKHAVELEPFQQDRYDRLVAVVFIGSRNVNAELVKQGHAWAYRHYMIPQVADFCAYEDHARRAKLGLWGLRKDRIVAPWEWRHKRAGAAYTSYSDETAAHCVAAIGHK